MLSIIVYGIQGSFLEDMMCVVIRMLRLQGLWNRGDEMIFCFC